MSIGERIKARRIELDMTQDELAEKLGYKSRSSINKIELGIQELRPSKILPIARALDTTVDYIMEWETEKRPTIEDLVEQLNDEGREKLLEYAEFLLEKYRK